MSISILSLLFFISAALYASVGSGGGSGYLALMSLVGFPPETMKPTALLLNILVAGIGTWKYGRLGHFSPRIFWPIAAASIPFAYWGGRLQLAAEVYRPMVGIVLLYAAFRLWRGSRGKQAPSPLKTLPTWASLLMGAAIGLGSGLLGIGGGIFLGPILLLGGWAETRQVMGITAAFVLVNSASGLLGHLSIVAELPAHLPVWMLAAAAGGWLGAEYGSRRLNPQVLRRLLSLVLVLGSMRMLLA